METKTLLKGWKRERRLHLARSLWGVSWCILQQKLIDAAKEALDLTTTVRDAHLREDQLHRQVSGHLFHMLGGEVGAMVAVEDGRNATGMPARVLFAPDRRRARRMLKKSRLVVLGVRSYSRALTTNCASEPVCVYVLREHLVGSRR